MMKQKSHRSIPASCKRLFHKLGLAVALSTIPGCPSVPPTINYVEPQPLTRREDVILNQFDLFKDCYCSQKQRRRNLKDSDANCNLSIYQYISFSSGFKPAVIEGHEHVPEIELDQSIVDFCVSAILRSKETTPQKNVASGIQPDKK